MKANFKKYIILWISQSLSQLGSSMTSYALILWAYTISNSALTVSLMSFCNYVPYIIVSLFAGAFVDRHNKKRIMLTSDTVAALCTMTILLLNHYNRLEMEHIYLVNCIIGSMNAFQTPASSVVIGKLVPKDKLSNVSGMNSFSSSLTTMVAPFLAAFLFALGGMKIILLIDLSSFIIAFLVLLLIISLPEDSTIITKNSSIFSGCKDGYLFLLQNKGILQIVITMALLNFFSRLTYENILSPMILSRSGNDSITLGIVNATMGLGGIIGGILVSSGKLTKNNIKMIYVSTTISFLLGDLLMGIGRNVFVWTLAGLAASLPIPYINAGQNVILYQKVPSDMQGRIFAVRNAIQYSTIPLGILLGGLLADYVFEPFMLNDTPVTSFLSLLVGEGIGSGIAVMFLLTGICGSLFSYLSYHKKEIQALNQNT